MSEVKVNKISPRTACGTVTLGDSGDTFTIPAGATITNNGTAAGFGATGAASWDTTVKTTGFTAVSGVGYFVNTTAGAITVTLPASPDAGAVVAVKDYANTFDTNNLTLARNGSNIGGQAIDATLSVEGLAVTLVYVDATKGWLVTDNGTQDTAPTPTFITATGGTITTSGDCKIHTFTGPGTFCVSAIANSAANNQVSYMVVAGGGGGGALGAGGAGGFREDKSSVTPYTSSPLEGAGPITVTATAFPITVGAGAPGSFPLATNTGSNSVFSTITSAGGGSGGFFSNCSGDAGSGGSGGGGSSPGSPPYPGRPGGSGNTPPTSPPQGNNGGPGVTGAGAGGGGGGAGAVGNTGGPPSTGGPGGNGVQTSINGSATYYAGGGGGGGGTKGNGGLGGGGDGRNDATSTPEEAGAVNTGGGGGADYSGTTGGAGGSGIVIIRYKFQ